MAGRLEVITGCMFSGKTEELWRRITRATIAKQKVLVFKPKIDTRYSCNEIVTHYGLKFSCFPLPSDLSFEIFITCYPEITAIQVVAFDEAQFFGSNFPDLCEKLVEMEKQVIVAGLDLDFKGEPFGPMPILMAKADEVSKLNAVCQRCGKPATRTQRLIDGKPASRNAPVIMIGGQDVYEARCRDCWEVSD